MTLSKLEMFATVANHRNVTRAAANLHISQPALTQQLKHLEETYNAKLYEKIGNGIALTDAGRLLFKYSREAAKQHNRIKEKISAVRTIAESVSLTVGGSYSPSMVLLPSLLVRFKTFHPNFQLRLTTANKEDIVRRIENGEIDIAVVNNPPPSRFLAAEPYGEEPLVAFVAPTYRLMRKRTLTVTDLSRLPLVIRQGKGGTGTAEQILKKLKQLGFTFEIAMRCDSPDAVKEAVRRNLGIGILFRTAIAADIRRREFKPIRLLGVDFSGKTFIVYHNRRPLSSAAQQFLKLLKVNGSKSLA